MNNINTNSLNKQTLSKLQKKTKEILPGLIIAAVLALMSQLIDARFGIPAMLLALIFGLLANSLSNKVFFKTGIVFTAGKILRIGVALLGARISSELLVDLGWQTALLVVAGLICTICFGLFLAKFFKIDKSFAFLTSGSVAICGASAALAISAILPKDKDREDQLVFTVVGVTILSTIAMIAYPFIASAIGFDHRQTGIFLGGTIHDVAQVVGAGFTVSEETGELATVVKLLRVLMLAPVILIASIIVRSKLQNQSSNGKRPPLIPFFVICFLVLAVCNSLGMIPPALSQTLISISKWLLLTAIAAVGLKTKPNCLVKVGGSIILLLCLETLFLGAFITGGLLIFS